MYRCIVAGPDFSPTAKRATGRAFLLASKLGAELVVVHAGSDPGESLRGLADEYGARAKVVSGPPAEDFDLIAVGSVGMSGSKRFTLGNVPHRVSHHASTDVLILRTA